MNFLNLFKHLLPNAKAWSLTVDKKLRQFFDGLTGLGEDTKEFIDEVYKDLDPETTREISLWEKQFGLPNTVLTDQERRGRLDSAWKAFGGQDPDYIQTTLQDAGFNVFVHEWWEDVAGRSGGSVDGDVTPVARNPFTYLWDGVSAREFTGCGNDNAFCGGDDMFANSQDSKPGYPLVNKILESNSGTIGSGHVQLFSGGLNAASGVDIVNFQQKQYIIPADTTKYPFFLYIGAQTFPEQASIPSSRRDEFEDLCLKICPAEQWLGILVSYS